MRQPRSSFENFEKQALFLLAKVKNKVNRTLIELLTKNIYKLIKTNVTAKIIGGSKKCQ